MIKRIVSHPAASLKYEGPGDTLLARQDRFHYPDVLATFLECPMRQSAPIPRRRGRGRADRRRSITSPAAI